MKIFAVINFLAGILIIYFVLTFGTQTLCMDCSYWHTIRGLLPMIIFGAFLVVSAIPLWFKKEWGKYFAALVWILGILFVILAAFLTRIIG